MPTSMEHAKSEKDMAAKVHGVSAAVQLNRPRKTSADLSPLATQQEKQEDRTSNEAALSPSFAAAVKEAEQAKLNKYVEADLDYEQEVTRLRESHEPKIREQLFEQDRQTELENQIIKDEILSIAKEYGWANVEFDDAMDGLDLVPVPHAAASPLDANRPNRSTIALPFDQTTCPGSLAVRASSSPSLNPLFPQEGIGFPFSGSNMDGGDNVDSDLSEDYPDLTHASDRVILKVYNKCLQEVIAEEARRGSNE